MTSRFEGGSVLVRLPEFRGLFNIDVRSVVLQNVMMYGGFEDTFLPFVESYLDPDRDVVDVGANVGLYTILSAKLVSSSRKVLAIEPTPGALNHLRSNVRLNGCQEKVIVFDGVALNEKAKAQLNIIPGKEEFATLGNHSLPQFSGEAAEEITVQGDTIDSIVENFSLDPGFVKIDAEGAEFKIVTGAARTLSAHKPVILSEVNDTFLRAQGSSSKQFLALLAENQYEIHDVRAWDRPIADSFEGEIIALPKRGLARSFLIN